MKVRELRVGNFVVSEISGIGRIDSIGSHHNELRYLIENCPHGPESISFIEITEKRLKQLKIKKLNIATKEFYEYYLVNTNYNIAYNHKSSEYVFKFMNNKLSSFKYVHELQNLYFQYSGKELL